MKTVKQIALTTALLVTFLAASHAQRKYLAEANKAYESKQYYRAIELYKKSLARLDDKHDKPRCLFQLGQSYRALNDWKQAENWYAKAAKSKYEDVRVYLYLAECKKMNAKYDEAIEQFRKYNSEVPDDPAGANGIRSSELALKWTAQPTRWKVENEKDLNTPQYDFSPAYYDKKHSSIIFASKREGQTGGAKVDPNTGCMYSDVYEARQSKVTKKGSSEQQWSIPTPLPAPLNTSANEGACVLNKKTDRMYFTRCGEEKKARITCKIYMAEKQGAGWSEGTLVDFGLEKDVLDSFNFRHPALSPDETVMIFSSDMRTGNMNPDGTSDLWMSVYDKWTKKWGSPVNLGSAVNTAGREGFPFVREDGTLYFASDGHAGMGGLDIFSARRVAADKWQWTSPANMQAPVNSPADDFGIIFDGRKDRGYLTSNREGSRGMDDIWRFYLPACAMDIDVRVSVCDTALQFRGAGMRLVGTDGSAVEAVTDASGHCNFVLLPDVSYVLSMLPYETKCGGAKYLESKEKYRFTTLGSGADFGPCNTRFEKEFCISLAEDSVEISFPAVLYATNSAALSKQAKDSLDILFRTLTEYPNIIIELGSHTDCRAGTSYNDRLSMLRAKACVDYLVKEKGLPAARISCKGYGENRPLKMTDGTVLSETFIASVKDKKKQEYYHQLNRRTVFRVLSFDYKDPAVQKEDRTIVIPKVRQGFWDEEDQQAD